MHPHHHEESGRGVCLCEAFQPNVHRVLRAGLLCKGAAPIRDPNKRVLPGVHAHVHHGSGTGVLLVDRISSRGAHGKPPDAGHSGALRDTPARPGLPPGHSGALKSAGAGALRSHSDPRSDVKRRPGPGPGPVRPPGFCSVLLNLKCIARIASFDS